MVKTNAQRQQAYRDRRALASRFGDSRLNLWVDGRAVKALKRLAADHRLTQRAMLEQLLLAADAQAQARLMPGSPAWDTYFQAGYGGPAKAMRGTERRRSVAVELPASGGTNHPE